MGFWKNLGLFTALTADNKDDRLLGLAVALGEEEKERQKEQQIQELLDCDFDDDFMDDEDEYDEDNY